MNSFGGCFRAHRTAAGCSMGDVARALGCSVAYISKMESDDASALTAENIIAACRLFNVSPDALLDMKATQRRKIEMPLSDVDTVRELQLLLYRHIALGSRADVIVAAIYGYTQSQDHRHGQGD